MTNEPMKEPPEFFRVISWSREQLIVYWRVLLSPIVLFALVCAFLAGYAISSARVSDRIAALVERIGVKDERVSFLNDEVGAYRERLKGATPDEAARKIASLEEAISGQSKKLQRLAPDNPRKLSAEQKLQLHDNIDRLKRDIASSKLLIAASSIGDAQDFAVELATFLSSEGVSVVAPVQTKCDPDEKGVMVELASAGKPSDDASDLFDVLHLAGFSPSYGTLGIIGGAKSDPLSFEIAVCPP